MRAVELYNRLKKYGLSVRGGGIYNSSCRIGEYATVRGEIEEVSGLDPKTDSMISDIILNG